MQTRSPFSMPISRSTLAILQTLSRSSEYEICCASSVGSLGSQIIAVLSPRVFRWRSMQFLVMLSLAFLNHLILASCMSYSTTLLQRWYHTKFSSAILSQNFLGFLIDFLYCLK